MPAKLYLLAMLIPAVPVLAVSSQLDPGELMPLRQAKSASSAGPEITPLRVNVNEVVVTFNAMDANGLPITDLKADEVRVRDNGVPPRRIVAFDKLANRPLRVGILLDTSESMQQTLPSHKAIAEKFVERLFRPKTDAAFVSSFGFGSEVLRSWSGDPALVATAIRAAGQKRSQQPGTAIFNAVFQACSSSFKSADPTATGNFILLFSDGEDNAGLASSDEAARACQRSNTEVFAFLPGSSSSHASTGPKSLRELASKTGGQVFAAEDSDEAIWRNLQEIELEMRNQYRLVYNPADLKHDGAFHEIELQPPDRVSRIVARSGYFAPSH